MRRGSARTLAYAGLLAAIAVVAVALLAGGSGSYTVHVLADDAGQLVKGNLVKVGGVEVGVVDAIELTSDNRADLTLKLDEGDVVPLRAGTRAEIRSTSLSAVAGRVVALAPGPGDAPEIPSGGSLRATDVEPIVDLDAVINTLDAQTRSGLQQLIQGGATALGGDRALANEGLRKLSPALTQTSRTLDELLADEPTFERLIVEGSQVVGAVAEREEDVAGGVVGAAQTAEALARRTSELDATLRGAPALLRRANTTLVNARAAVQDLRPAVRDAGPVAPRLARFIGTAQPVVRAARPVVGDLRSLLPDASKLLAVTPRLERIARPAFGWTTKAVGDLDEAGITQGLRAYTPDVVSGLLNGFGTTAAGYYDANGHYARISIPLGPLSAGGIASGLGLEKLELGDLDLRTGRVSRCPGSAYQPSADGSSPWTTATPCNPEDTLP
jgi:phospholipid/cholesterol/gamma-HCH transport system substrate-binding protein